MSNHEKDIETMLFGFLRRQVTLRQLEAWVYATDELERVLGFDRDEQLLGFDFRQPEAQRLLDEILLPICERLWPAEHEREQARRYMCGLVNDTVDIFEACWWLTWRRNAGGTWIPISFVGLDSELDWYESIEEGQAAAGFDAYKQQAQEAAAELLAREFPTIPCA
jgi:hypothetical protein